MSTTGDNAIVERRRAEIFAEREQANYQATDRLFAWLLAGEFLAGILLAVIVAPQVWASSTGASAAPLWAAILLGAAVAGPAVGLALLLPGRAFTRHAIAVAQMLMSALFIHLTGGRIETHFHIFGSLACLVFYRDWSLFITALAVVGLDHGVRGALWPESAFGSSRVDPWRWAEHAGWLLFETAFLTLVCVRNRQEMLGFAQQKAALEFAHASVEEQVAARTQELVHSKEQFELAVAGSNDGIWDWNIATGECFFSPRCYELWGYRNGDLREVARFDDLLARVYSSDLPTVQQSLAAHLDEAQSFAVTCRLATVDGVYRWFRLCGQAARDAAGRARRMAGSLSDLTHLKHAEENLSRSALTDRLTGLPNRALLLDRVEQAIAKEQRHGRHFALMFLDFDRFKVINDSLGHDVGDALLREIAERLRRHVRCTDTVTRQVDGPSAARMGGDEFVLLIDEIRLPEHAQTVAARLLEAFKRPFLIGENEIFITASIGIVITHGRYQKAEEVLRDADTAMYEAKRAGGGKYVLFDDAMRARIQRRHLLENDLRRAIAGNQLWLAYQPIVSLATGEVHSVEALLRWNHPTAGPIGPAEFIPIAEESELILALGDWVLEAAARQMARWIDELGDAAPRTISVNVSRKQFGRPDLPDRIAAILNAAGVPAERIQLEVTEDYFAGDLQAAIAAMHALKRLGVYLAIDDFGTGCSSFASLHEFPADVLKIDRSLIKDLDSSHDTAALVHSLAILVHNLDMEMVAEGIETESTLAALRQLGCHYGQGYFICRPVPAAECEAFLADHGRLTETIQSSAGLEFRWPELTERAVL